MDLVEVGDGADHVPGAGPFFRSGRHGFSFSDPGAGEQVPPRIFRRKLAELAEQIAHALIHRFWHHHLYLDVLGAPANAPAARPFHAGGTSARCWCPAECAAPSDRPWWAPRFWRRAWLR